MLSAIVAAAVGGLAFERLRLPGGLLIGALVGSATVTVLFARPQPVPEALTLAVPVAIGVITGTLVTKEVLRALRPMVLPAVGSALVIVAAGLGVALLLETLGIAPPAAVLATSPGALSVLIATSVDLGVGEAEVALFHMVRIVVVLLLTPLLVRWLLRNPVDPGDGGLDGGELS